MLKLILDNSYVIDLDSNVVSIKGNKTYKNNSLHSNYFSIRNQDFPNIKMSDTIFPKIRSSKSVKVEYAEVEIFSFSSFSANISYKTIDGIFYEDIEIVASVDVGAL